jgi:aryl-alcohol dehydrogenase
MNQPTVVTAAVLRSAAGPFTLETLTLPPPGPGEVLVRVAGAGVCHTDLLPRTGGRWGTPPIVLGHEAAGVVEAIGPDAGQIRPGDHVVASFASCAHCPQCLAGRPPYCEQFWPLNFSGAPPGSRLAEDSDGKPVSSRWFGQSSFATHAVVAAASLVRVPTNLPLATLAPLGCGVLTGAASILCGLAVRPGATVAVLGTGSVGLSAVLAARLAGARHITAVDLHQGRLDLAAEFGAEHLVRPAGGTSLTDQLRDRVPRGFDHCLDTTGIPAVIAAAVEALTATGVCGLVGAPRGPLQLAPAALAVGRTVRGLLFGDADPQVWIPTLVRHWQDGNFPFDRLVTTYPLASINEAEADSRNGAAIKPVLLPGT